MKKLFSIILGTALLISCSIDQHFHFNDDYSGNYLMEFDMSALMDFAGEMDSTDSDEDIWGDLPMDSMQDAMNAVVGINNAKFFEENNVLKMSYEFENLEALNSALANSDLEDSEEDDVLGALMGDATNFEAKGKKFYYTTPDISTVEIADSMTEYMEMFEYAVTMSYENDIKKIENSDAIIGEDNKSFTLKGNFKELMLGEKQLSTEVRLK